ncbi:MAG TPA: ATP-dependent DNA helicase RecG [Thermoleophilaceae bacterium]|nr:ATP-dependent DNA helicase RecG [Thermoleophilaceae bacterium]
MRSAPKPSRLGRPVEFPKRAQEAAAALGLETAGDLLEYFPRAHADRRDVRPIASLGVGDKATVAGVIRSIKVRPTRNRRVKLVEAKVADESGPITAVWFNQPWLATKLPEGTRVLLHGECRRRNQFTVAEYEIADDAAAAVHTVGFVPVYAATKGITPAMVRERTDAIRALVHDTVEPLPALLRAKRKLPDRPAALAAAHFPEDEAEHEQARIRLAFEELLMLELEVARRKRARQEDGRARPLEATGEMVAPWLEQLPFTLTGDQRRAVERIDRDIARDRPMQRLLMGDVGTGKTAVSLHAMLRALENGRQAALMAPTETLAEQHLLTLDRLLGGLVPIALLTGSTSAARRREILARLATGELNLIVGTHALIEPAVEFRDLALYVIDEQHRFGVRQRAALDRKAPAGLLPHALHMTATPIPRTLALTAYGDLDATTLRELPAGRGPVETHAVDGERARARAYARIREEIARGRQCFVVCPLVTESEALQAKAAVDEAERLQATEFKDHRVQLIHGQMPTQRKQEAMRAFASGAADVLVATSVIEVGIDVPNATVMLIEEAERYGISQLHQLRGRIGRGNHPGLCILFGSPQNPRLAAVAAQRDGFALAEIDLELRGAGEVLGTRQHGLPEFNVARLPEDADLLQDARDAAEELLARDPELELAEHVLLRDAAVARFGADLDLIPA